MTMTYAVFYNDGYDYLDEGNYTLFSSDSTHEALFHYVAIDMTSLSELFEQYINSKIDSTTLELRHSTESDIIISKIIKLMKSFHPYYSHEYKKVIIKAIGEYFNELLIYSVYKQNSITPELPLQKDWYFNRLKGLMPFFIQEENDFYPDGAYPDDFYNKYRNWIDDRDFDTRRIEETLLPVPKTMPSIFSAEIETHKTICSMLYFILDASADALKDLSISQRIWFFSNIFYSWSQTHITKRLSFLPPIIYKENDDYSHEVEHRSEIYDVFTPIYMLNNLDTEYENLSALIPESFSLAIEYAKKYGNSVFYEKYEINSLFELLLQEVLFMIKSNIKIKKCNNCGIYFATNKSNQIYCKRLFEKTQKTCSEIGPSRNHRKNKDPVRKFYDTIYNKHYSLTRKDIPASMNKFNLWEKEASAKYKEMRNGELSVEAFTKWLIETTRGLGGKKFTRFT